jgi:hypothetical protein
VGSLTGVIGERDRPLPYRGWDGRYLTVEGCGDYAGLLRLTTEQNNFGGGHPIQPWLTEALRFEIHGVALVA